MTDPGVSGKEINQSGLTKSGIRAIAFLLPQFHPTPENDQWWGKGFTEWTNVLRGKPLFSGHYQPHLPSELGFYDLRIPSVREAQANLAREYGIHGFCYYHYWFQGRRLLETPFNDVLISGRPKFPFCLCWANESWTRNWDGGKKELLIEQHYSLEDDRNHIHCLINAFKDDRYIRVEGKPIFLVYRANRLPDPIQTTTIWRDEAFKSGIGEIFLCRVESFPDEHNDPSGLGFDASVEFQPDWANLPIMRKLLRRFSLEFGFKYHDVYDYGKFTDRMLKKKEPVYRRFPCVTPSWDNSPRRKSQTTILTNSNPALYENWLREVVRNIRSKELDENLVFINAWNEWGEGSHLEPCQKWSRAYLEATYRALHQGE